MTDLRPDQIQRTTSALARRYDAQGTSEHGSADALVQATSRNCSDDERKWARINFIHGGR